MTKQKDEPFQTARGGEGGSPQTFTQWDGICVCVCVGGGRLGLREGCE